MKIHRSVLIAVTVPVLLVLVNTRPASAGLIYGCKKNTTGRITDIGTVPPTCNSAHTLISWNQDGPPGPPGPGGPIGPPGPTLALVVTDDFDTLTGLESGNLDPWIWNATTSGTGSLTFFPGYLNINSGGGGGEATLTNRKSFSVLDGDLIFKARLYAYAENTTGCCVYGNKQPRGLVAGTDRNNAIEFISIDGSSIACRTVSGGMATETIATIPVVAEDTGTSPIYNPLVYQIIAKSDQVKFFINGDLVATHTSNIPTAALNVYLSSSSPIGFVAIYADFVSFERRQ